MKSIRREMVWPHPPERVWRALTDPDILALWMMKTTLRGEPVVGKEFEFHTKSAPGFDGVIRCRFLEVNRPHRLVFTWATGKGTVRPTTVTWSLRPVSGGTEIVLEHHGFQGMMGFVARHMMQSGWDKKVTRYLGVVLDRIAQSGDSATLLDTSSLMDCVPEERPV